MRYLVVALFSFALAGCLSADSPDGALMCSDVPKRACPEGFYCLASSNTCWRYGHFPDDMAIPSRFNPGGPEFDFSIPVGDDGGLDDGGLVDGGLDGGTDDLLQTD